MAFGRQVSVAAGSHRSKYRVREPKLLLVEATSPLGLHAEANCPREHSTRSPKGGRGGAEWASTPVGAHLFFGRPTGLPSVYRGNFWENDITRFSFRRLSSGAPSSEAGLLGHLGIPLVTLPRGIAKSEVDVPFCLFSTPTKPAAQVDDCPFKRILLSLTPGRITSKPTVGLFLPASPENNRRHNLVGSESVSGPSPNGAVAFLRGGCT